MSRNDALPPVRACLFDMDGLLIDSEDLYTICTNEILHKYGKPDLPWHIKSQLQGRPAPESGRIFQEWAQLPITRDEFMGQTIALQQKYFPSCKPLLGVPGLLDTLHRTSDPHVHTALATSSTTTNFHLKTDHIANLFSVFPQANRVLGDDPRIPPGKGKPAPDIYLLALKTINDALKEKGEPGDIKPQECLVFEDSVPGVESGRRAGMQVVWCPHPELLVEYRGREKEVLAGLTGQHSQRIAPAIEATGDQQVPGRPGKVDDGWALLLESLEQFPYQRFGIKVDP